VLETAVLLEGISVLVAEAELLEAEVLVAEAEELDETMELLEEEEEEALVLVALALLLLLGRPQLPNGSWQPVPQWSELEPQ
jgi:hypothetical protein